MKKLGVLKRILFLTTLSLIFSSCSSLKAEDVKIDNEVRYAALSWKRVDNLKGDFVLSPYSDINARLTLPPSFQVPNYKAEKPTNPLRVVSRLTTLIDDYEMAEDRFFLVKSLTKSGYLNFISAYDPDSAVSLFNVYNDEKYVGLTHRPSNIGNDAEGCYELILEKCDSINAYRLEFHEWSDLGSSSGYLAYRNGQLTVDYDGNSSSMYWYINDVSKAIGIANDLFTKIDGLEPRTNRISPYSNGATTTRTGRFYSYSAYSPNLEYRYYDDHTEFFVDPNADFSLRLSNLFAHSSYSIDDETTNMYFTCDQEKDSSKQNLTIKIKNIGQQYTDKYGNTTSTSYKYALLLEKQNEYGNYEICYALNNMTSDLNYDTLTIPKADYLNGATFRIRYRYDISFTHVHKGGFLNLGTKTYDETKEESILSEPFYVVNRASKVISITNLTEKLMSPQDEYGHEISSYYASSQINIKASKPYFTTTGFKIEDLGLDPDLFVEVTSGTSFTKTSSYPFQEYREQGNYTVHVKSSLFEETRYQIYVYTDHEELNKRPFNVLNEEDSFIHGERVLGGTLSEELQAMGIKLPYSNISYPLYKKGVTITTLGSIDSKLSISNYNSLTNVYYSFSTDNSLYNLNHKNSKYTPYALVKPGLYTITLTNSWNYTGEIINLTYNFYVVEEDSKPFLNEYLIYNCSHELYDLKPLFYYVPVIKRFLTFNIYSGFITKYKELRYVFSSYEEAYEFSLSHEANKYDDTDKYDEDHYFIDFKMMDEYELYLYLVNKAKSSIHESYFMMSDTEEVNYISSSDIEIEDYLSNDNFDIPYIYVTSDTESLAKMTSRKPLINSYKFINVLNGIDSNSVILIGPNNEQYSINYNEKVGDQLRAYNAPSGDYKVRETDIYGGINEYKVSYINSTDGNDASISLTYNDATHVINKLNLEKIISNTTVTINEVYNPNDNEELIIVTDTFNSSSKAYNTSTIKDLTLSSGTYLIHVEDRIGNYFEFEVEINEL